MDNNFGTGNHLTLKSLVKEIHLLISQLLKAENEMHLLEGRDTVVWKQHRRGPSAPLCQKERPWSVGGREGFSSDQDPRPCTSLPSNKPALPTNPAAALCTRGVFGTLFTLVEHTVAETACHSNRPAFSAKNAILFKTD